MIADRNGKFIHTQFKGKTPGKEVCWFGGDCEDYGFLFKDGTYEGHYSRMAWENVLFFQLSAGNGIAVTADRKAVDRNGKEICENAAAVSFCGKRYMILCKDGSIITDQGKIGLCRPPSEAFVQMHTVIGLLQMKPCIVEESRKQKIFDFSIK